MPNPPGPAHVFVEPDPELLRAFHAQCKLVSRLWRLKDEARRAAERARGKSAR